MSGGRAAAFGINSVCSAWFNSAEVQRKEAAAWRQRFSSTMLLVQEVQRHGVCVDACGVGRQNIPLHWLLLPSMVLVRHVKLVCRLFCARLRLPQITLTTAALTGCWRQRKVRRGSPVVQPQLLIRTEAVSLLLFFLVIKCLFSSMSLLSCQSVSEGGPNGSIGSRLLRTVSCNAAQGRNTLLYVSAAPAPIRLALCSYSPHAPQVCNVYYRHMH